VEVRVCIQTLTAARVELLLSLVSHQQERLIGPVALGTNATDEAYSTPN
jgi:hypothetical protein